MSRLSLGLPDSIRRQLKRAAAEDGISIDQLVSLAVAEKLSALQTYDIIAERAEGGRARASCRRWLWFRRGRLWRVTNRAETHDITRLPREQTVCKLEKCPGPDSICNDLLRSPIEYRLNLSKRLYV